MLSDLLPNLGVLKDKDGVLLNILIDRVDYIEKKILSPLPFFKSAYAVKCEAAKHSTLNSYEVFTFVKYLSDLDTIR